MHNGIHDGHQLILVCHLFPLCLRQVGVYLEEADQVDVAGGAFLKGIKAQPQQPELPRQQEMAAAAQHLVLLADGINVRWVVWEPQGGERIN